MQMQLTSLFPFPARSLCLLPYIRRAPLGDLRDLEFRRRLGLNEDPLGILQSPIPRPKDEEAHSVE